jgi:4'-phosphopantetheinyl transferase
MTPIRARYIRALAGLNRVLATYLDRPPEQIRIERHPTGKPYLDGADRLAVLQLQSQW